MDFSCSIRKKKIKRGDRKVSSQRLSSSFPLDPPLLIIRRHPPSFLAMNSKAIDRSISAYNRFDANYVAKNFGRARQRLITISVSRDHYSPYLSFCLKNYLLFMNHPLQSPPLILLLLFPLLLSLFFLLLLWLLLRYFNFSSYSRAQFCVLLPPVTLAENNNKICSPSLDQGRRWFSHAVLLSISSSSNFNLCLSALFLNFFSFVFISHFSACRNSQQINKARRRQMFLNLIKEI